MAKRSAGVLGLLRCARNDAARVSCSGRRIDDWRHTTASVPRIQEWTSAARVCSLR
jgi:hypothetical protein